MQEVGAIIVSESASEKLLLYIYICAYKEPHTLLKCVCVCVCVCVYEFI